MRLYQITLPHFDNAGHSTALSRTAFKREVCEMCGGYTEFVATGVWRDDYGKEYPEKNDIVQIAHWLTSPHAMDASLTAVFKRFFPDQKAMFLADIGTAQIINLKEKGLA